MIDILILAGGLGTRLGRLTKRIPKPMLKIKKKIFITYIIDFFVSFGFTKINISTGYKQEVVKKYFYKNSNYQNIKMFPENSPLGTGGAVKFFLQKKKRIKDLLVVNGDTFFNFNVKKVYLKFKKIKKSLIICKKIKSDARYGNIIINNKGSVINFFEKGICKKKFMVINSGYYFFKREDLKNLSIPSSLEKYLENNIGNIKLKTYTSAGTFIDIGIKKDLNLSKRILSKYENINIKRN